MKVRGKSYPLSANQLLLKGSILKNTLYAVGFVVYSGNQTRLMMNSKKSRFKLSKVERKMNNLVVSILAVQFSLSLLVSFIDIKTYKADHVPFTYLNMYENTGTNWIETVFRYFLLLNTLIPISLIVTIEMVKLVQAYFIANDA